MKVFYPSRVWARVHQVLGQLLLQCFAVHFRFERALGGLLALVPQGPGFDGTDRDPSSTDFG